MKMKRYIQPLALAIAFALSAGYASAGETCTTTPTPPTAPSAPDADSLACGNGAQASEARTTALGVRAVAGLAGATAVGFDARATGNGSTAIGRSAFASGVSAIAIGNRAVASESSTTAVGGGAVASAFGASAFGNGAEARGRDSTSIGFGIASGEGSNAFGTVFAGTRTQASGLFSNAFGSGAIATADYTDAYGTGAQATATNSVALGSGSIADRANTVSVGSATQQRQITHVAAGTQATDAVNLQQLRDTLDTARAYTDTAVATGGTQANAYTDNREAAIRSDMTAADTQLRNEMQQGDAQTLQSARNYVDQRFAQVLGADLASFDRRIDSLEARMGSQDIRISRLGALSAAMTQMTANAMGTQSARGRLSVGAGWYGGESALSVGYGRKLGSRMSVTLGGAFSASERSAGVGFGVDL